MTGVQSVFIELPFGVMFFRKTDQLFDLYLFAFVCDRKAVVAAKHLVDFACDNPKVGLCQTVFERCESQVEAVLGVSKFPGLHIIA